jgi:hypothetical protein
LEFTEAIDRMPCKEVMDKKYQTRKSPAFHAKDCKGITKKGKDGNYISKPDSNGTYKWVKIATGNNKTRKVKRKAYYIHDNGGRPFKVILDNKTVSIYKNTTKYPEDEIYDGLVKTVSPKEIFIGKSSGKSYMSDHSPAQAKEFIGNSILLEISAKKYMYIGTEIYTFETEDVIESYFSLVGNNDVPYPIALGTDNVYFMLDHTYVKREMVAFPKMKAVDWEGVYAMYYGFRHPVSGEEVEARNNSEKIKLEQYAKKMKGFHVVQKRL